MDKKRNPKSFPYKCNFDGYSPVVSSITVYAVSCEDALEQCKLIMGEHLVRDSLNSVSIDLPF